MNSLFTSAFWIQEILGIAHRHNMVTGGSRHSGRVSKRSFPFSRAVLAGRNIDTDRNSPDLRSGLLHCQAPKRAETYSMPTEPPRPRPRTILLFPAGFRANASNGPHSSPAFREELIADALGILRSVERKILHHRSRKVWPCPLSLSLKVVLNLRHTLSLTHAWRFQLTSIVCQ